MKAGMLSEYKLAGFDINTASASGIVEVDGKNKVAYSKWVTPKRTRSYPFARIYDTYSFGGKRVTIIPVIKDEGVGASKNKSNNDRINFITLSWMNLTNVFVILAWYSAAKKKSRYRITDQTFDEFYVRKKIREISEYQLDAHHWNNEHFRNDFVAIFKNAVSAYERIAKKLAVKMHSASGHLVCLKKIVDSPNEKKLSLEKFANETLGKSKLAASREIGVKHKHEHLSTKNSKKLVFEIKNNLGGSYFLTADEIILHKNKKELVIQESKNATKDKLPKGADIKDGLFKIMLFSQIKSLTIDGDAYKYKVKLKLTGKLSGSLQLPSSKERISSYVGAQKFSKSDEALIAMLDEEARANNYEVEITGN